MPSIQSIPVEVNVMILKSLDNLEALVNAIKASPSLLRAYSTSRGGIISTIAQFPSDYEFKKMALAVLHCPSFRNVMAETTGDSFGAKARATRANWHDRVETFVDCYLSGDETIFPIPTTVKEWVAVNRLCCDVDAFVEAFARTRARATTPTANKQTAVTYNITIGQEPSDKLSLTEEHRIRRAFFHWELCVRLFGPSSAAAAENDDKKNQLSSEAHLKAMMAFLRRLPTWQAEEVVDVQQFLHSEVFWTLQKGFCTEEKHLDEVTDVFKTGLGMALFKRILVSGPATRQAAIVSVGATFREMTAACRLLTRQVLEAAAARQQPTPAQQAAFVELAEEANWHYFTFGISSFATLKRTGQIFWDKGRKALPNAFASPRPGSYLAKPPALLPFLESLKKAMYKAEA